MFSNCKTRQASMSLLVKHGKIPLLHDYTPGLPSIWIPGKQTTESLPDNTWERKGPGTGAVCVGRQHLFITLHYICFLSSHRHKRWFPASSVPLKSFQRVCLCQPLVCFRDYIFVPFLSWIPLHVCLKGIQLHPLTQTHTDTINSEYCAIPYFPIVKLSINLLFPWYYIGVLLQHSFFYTFNNPLGIMVRLIRSSGNIVVRPVRVVTKKRPRETIIDLIDVQ